MHFSNPVKQRLRQGEPVIGIFITQMCQPCLGRLMKLAGYDFLLIDMEHSQFDLGEVAALIRASRDAGIEPFFRSADKERSYISRPLDAGATGLMVPRVESGDEAQRILSWIWYPPMGTRGVILGGANTDFEAVDASEYTREANEEVLVMLQIETARGVDAVQDIVGLPGCDAPFIGPLDLSQTLGLPGQIHHPVVEEAIGKVISAAQAHQKWPGIYVPDVAAARKWLDRGMRVILLNSEVGLMMAHARQDLRSIRG